MKSKLKKIKNLSKIRVYQHALEKIKRQQNSLTSCDFGC
jgi:hypothetical protein